MIARRQRNTKSLTEQIEGAVKCLLLCETYRKVPFGIKRLRYNFRAVFLAAHAHFTIGITEACAERNKQTPHQHFAHKACRFPLLLV